MLYRKFDPGEIYKNFAHEKFADFNDWRTRAKTAAEALADWQVNHPFRQKGESLPVDAEIYGALKPCLKDYFYGKCAYCESEFATVAWGDVEHYRPKRGVADDKTHPGYYWLAYHERNLMTSCQLCNQGRGKRNWFPIAGQRAMRPEDDLSNEQPLLLNPYEEADCGERAGHLQYVFEENGWDLLSTGRVDGLTDRGRKSVGLYDLNRETLVGRRRKSQQHAITILELLAARPREFAENWALLFKPDQEHASAMRAACWKWLEHHKKQLDRATGGQTG
ncbi:MAG: hypothetical protein ABSF64_01120 [Bryobacteraceae bacterium]|jgi:hypothetical protein